MKISKKIKLKKKKILVISKFFKTFVKFKIANRVQQQQKCILTKNLIYILQLFIKREVQAIRLHSIFIIFHKKMRKTFVFIILMNREFAE